MLPCNYGYNVKVVVEKSDVLRQVSSLARVNGLKVSSDLRIVALPLPKCSSTLEGTVAMGMPINYNLTSPFQVFPNH